eukprot:TRINITY_DN664_c1_g1_i1.p8 TRINITY_DN664_c1_g1~~TRINITY_DN664_c1_g1_i1.p8  ORF type:complete len:151 (-),score=3.64 TRINITY_DN664_c1_g1_i1:78-530(-)
MHLFGTPDIHRKTLAQGQQAGGVVHLAVHQHNGINTRVSQCSGRLHGVERGQLGANVGGRVKQDPVLAVFTDGNGRLGTGPGVQGALPEAVAVGAVTVPLGKATACSGAQNVNQHGGLLHKQNGQLEAGRFSTQRLAKYIVTSKPMRRSS